MCDICDIGILVHLFNIIPDLHILLQILHMPKDSQYICDELKFAMVCCVDWHDKNNLWTALVLIHSCPHFASWLLVLILTDYPLISDVHGLTSGQKPSRATQARPSQAKSVGLELALAWPGLPESQSQWLRPWLWAQYFWEITALCIAPVIAQQVWKSNFLWYQSEVIHFWTNLA